MKRLAHIHSLNGELQEVEIIKWTDNNDIVVKTANGVTCTAIFNCFVGCLYADDIYGRCAGV